VGGGNVNGGSVGEARIGRRKGRGNMKGEGGGKGDGW